MNFALMFALALGIDYALFVVHRFRAAFFGSKLPARDAVAVTMDTAGKAVLFSGVTVLISLSAVMLVPSPAFRSMALGIMLSVVFVLAATLTLLPAVLAKLGPRVDRLSLRWVHSGEHRSARFAAWGELLWRRPLPVRLARAGGAPAARAAGARPAHRDAVDQGRAGGRRFARRLHPGSAGVRARRSGRPPDRRAHCHGLGRRDNRGPRPQHRARAAGAAGTERPRSRAGDPERRPVEHEPSARRSTVCARTYPRERSSAARSPRTTTSSGRSPLERRS